MVNCKRKSLTLFKQRFGAMMCLLHNSKLLLWLSVLNLLNIGWMQCRITILTHMYIYVHLKNLL